MTEPRNSSGKAPIMFQPLRNTLASVSAGFAVAVVAFALPRQLEPFENLIYDAMVRTTAEPFEGSGIITLIDVDESSLARVGQWPWPRRDLARIVDRVSAGAPLALVFDAIFPEPDRLSPDQYLPDVAEDAGVTLNPEAVLPSFDQQFADAIARGPVVLGQNNLLIPATTAGARGSLGPAQATQSKTFQRRPTINLLASDVNLIEGGYPPSAFQLPALLSNLPELDEAASGLGVVTLPADADGIARSMPLVFVHEGRTLPSLSMEALRVALTSRGQIVRVEPRGISEVSVQGRLGRVVIPTDPRGRLWIRFPRLPEGQTRYFRVVSAAAVLEQDFDPGIFANQIVIFGSSAAGLFDLKSTPLGSNSKLPGMDLQAMTIHQALVGGMVRVVDATLWELLAAAVFLIYGLTLAPRLPGLANSGVLALCLVVAAGVQVWFFTVESTYMSLFGLIVFLLGYGGLSLVALLVGRDRQRREIKSAFSQYLSPALVNRISRTPGRLKLGGEQKELSILFADLRGFTTVSESFKDDPATLTAIINGILTPLTEIVHAHQGTVDKYIGDCIMAFWNAPLDVADHADQAVQAAIAMVDAMPGINASLEAEFNHGGFRLGVGVNSGSVVVGNMGSQARFDYSVLGDAVNLAARLEGQSKVYGVDVLVGEQTRLLCREDRAGLIQIDQLRVKGKSESVGVYTPLPDATETDREAHFVALAAYRGQDLSAAELALASMQGRFERRLDPLYSLLLSRRRQIQADQTQDWSGVWEALEK